MQNFTTETQRIAALTPKPPEHTEVAIPVLLSIIREAKAFADEYHPDDRLDGMTRDELVLLSGVFLTAVERIGLRTYHLMHWLHRSGRFDADLMREYAEQELGMERVEAPVRRGRRKAA